MNQVQKLYDLLKRGKPIHIRNRTGRKKGVQTKLIMLQIVSQSGVQKTIKIPPTRFPIPISTMVAPPSLLGESQDFVELLNKKEIEIIDPKAASKELSDPNVAAAVERSLSKIYERGVPGMEVSGGPKVLAQGESAGERTGKSPMASAAEEAKTAMSALERSPLAPLAVSSDSVTINPRIAQMMSDLNKDHGLASEMVLDLQGMSEDDYGEKELSYIMSQASWCTPIVKWAEDLLAAMMEDDDEDDDDESFEVTTVPDSDDEGLSEDDVDARLEEAASLSESTRKKPAAKKATTKRKRKKKKSRK
jgi:hypothetical protein